MKKLLILIIVLICQVHVFPQFEFYKNYNLEKTNTIHQLNAINVNLDSLKLDSVITAYKNSQSIPGIASLIIKDNKVIWNKNYGYRNLEFQLPVEDSTFFLIGSISKTILATAVMQLWENGKIELEGNINDYLPNGFKVVNPYYPNNKITIKMLMTHTSSIQDNWDIMGYNWTCGDSPIPYDTFLINYFTPGGSDYSKNNFHNYLPGKYYDYANAGSCLLALIVENLSGKSFDEYVKDSIFTPLSMNNSSYFLARLDTTKIAIPYMYRPPVPTCHTGFPYWPIGQIRTNKFELANFVSAYVNGGVFKNSRILKNSTIEMMLKDQMGFKDTYGETQGLIWYTDPSTFNNVWGHTGGWFGAATWMFCNPQEKWGILFFVNWATIIFSSGTFNFTENPPIPQMEQYAHFYGNIFSYKPSMDKSYARMNTDSVLFRTTFSNINNHPFSAHLIYTNSDRTQIDSINLFDDGLHGDILSTDGFFGGYVPPQNTEDFYSLSVSTIDNENNKYFNTPDISRFTTVGPVALDSISIIKSTSDYYTVKPFIKNESTSTTIKNARLRLISNDPWISTIFSPIKNLPPINPGATVGPSSTCRVIYIDTLFHGYFNFKVEIMIDGWTYWTDSTKVIVTGVNEETIKPISFRLEQNYPNPFNPTTAIKYSIPKQSYVTLKIFDILGKDVETLINEEKPAGYYEVEFNAANLPSGVYFYRIQAGSFNQVRKMLLIK